MKEQECGIESAKRRSLIAGFLVFLLSVLVSALPAFGATCANTVTADVVALDQLIWYNRLGVNNPIGMIYALRRDVVDAAGVPLTLGGGATPGQVFLRADKRPRPITLRVNEGDCLQITFTNLLSPVPLIRPDPVTGQPFNDQPVTRHAGIHVQGLQLVNSILDDGSNAGNIAAPGSLVLPGQTITYTVFAEREGGYLLESTAAQTGGEGGNGTDGFGLFGMVNVQLPGAEWYRSQLTREEMDLATLKDPVTNAPLTTPTGQPLIDYDAVYPTVAPFVAEGKAGLPIVKILNGTEIVHSDLNAIITGPGRTPPTGEPPNPAYPYRNQQSFREFTMVFHDEITAIQAFALFRDPNFKFTLGSVKDGFAINYGTGGIAAEIIGNRLGVGPMFECAECKYEEFFLTSWAVGDPAMVVDIPANFGQDFAGTVPPIPGPKATKALYPEDPSNVWHSYENDRVKIRNAHIGTEHHIFHLHAHQWLFTPDDDNSNYLDAQAIGPGSSFTYEIAYGAGNRNKSPGDAIFHCHFYPHFAQGMWGLWRTHDVFEQGTLMAIDPVDGLPVPAAGARALPDAEIAAGTPIPALVPIPGIPMAPMPGADVDIVAGQPVITPIAGDPFGNPGFPFFITGVAGHRPPTPPLDILDDGGLPRHIVTGGAAVSVENPRSFFKELVEAHVVYPPETGSPEEVAAMNFHQQLLHPTSLPNGTAAQFETNGLPPAPGAPFAEPCRGDSFPGGTPFGSVDQIIDRTYKGANVQFDMILNKVGWHFPQSRIISLWEDVAPTLAGTKPPEPFVMRANTGECVEFHHTNLVPNLYIGDDFQVETPTDIIGQHIHLVKFDVTSADGAANGWNYEDGTLSPSEVRERIRAIRAAAVPPCVGALSGDPRDGTGDCPVPVLHPFFGNVPVGVDPVDGEPIALGARTTIQRWYIDPLRNLAGQDRGLGNVFSHDHYGPSTHQQVGLYGTLLVEPAGSTYKQGETGVALGTRADGGPTSWNAIIESGDPGQAPFREFYLEYADYQLAYEALGVPTATRTIVDPVTHLPVTTTVPGNANVVNPSQRLELPPPLLVQDGLCGALRPGDPAPNRPCPEAISAADPGTFVVNYRNEPVALRVRDPLTNTQAPGTLGDLSHVYRSINRADPALNLPGPYPPLTQDVKGNDPFTPLLRTYEGDNIRVRIQVGATEESHWASIHGLEWTQEYFSPNTGYRNSQHAGISEQFQFRAPILAGPNQAGNSADYLYNTTSTTDGAWNGNWGLLRTYQRARKDLAQVSNNDPNRIQIANRNEFMDLCPVTAPVQPYDVTAVLAQDVLPLVDTGAEGIQRTLVYNSRLGPNGEGPLHDPTAILYVMTQDLVLPAGFVPDPNVCFVPDPLDPTVLLFDAAQPDCCFAADGITPALTNLGCPVELAADAPIEPLVLRAAAGECIEVTLNNKLRPDDALTGANLMPDLDGYNVLPAIIDNFNNNQVKPSSVAGLHPQLVAYDITRDDGTNVGGNPTQTVFPGGTTRLYRWYAGNTTVEPIPGDRRGRSQLVATPMEYGAINLMSPDPIKHAAKAAVGALVIEPLGATWLCDGAGGTLVPCVDPLGLAPRPVTRAQAVVTKTDLTTFRDFALVIQDDVNMRFNGFPGATIGGVLSPAVAAGPVPAVAAEREPDDAGQKAFNYGTEPMWFRFGYGPTAVPGVTRKVDFTNAFNNALVGGDPETPVFTAFTGEEVRLRVLKPGGHGRANNLTLHGHVWQREPYDSTVGDSSVIGYNDLSFWHGEQMGMGPSNHFDIVPMNGAGGAFGVPGDYLLRDTVPVLVDNGEWGLLRVTP